MSELENNMNASGTGLGNGNGTYTADNIQVLEGLEAVRKRPAMYIGDISVKGLHHLVYEVVDNSIDEAMAGYCNQIIVSVLPDNSIRVTDNGRGIPTDYHEKEKKSALEVVMTVLHAGGKFDKGSYKVSGGLHGVGVSCVNALSIMLKVTVNRDGKVFEQEYSQGKPLYAVRVAGESDYTGTTVHFKPDNTIFITEVFDINILAARLRELSFLNKGIELTLIDEREKDDDGNFIFERVVCPIRHNCKKGICLPPITGKLSERELQVIALFAKGFHEDEIGERLFISKSTVHNHITNIYQKLNLTGRNPDRQLIVYAFRNNYCC